MSIETTFAFIKQSAQNGTENEKNPVPTGLLESPLIIQDFVDQVRNAGLSIVLAGFSKFSKECIEEHYSHHKGKDFYKSLVDWNSETLVLPMKIEGESASRIVRDIAFDVREKYKRSKYSNANIVHTSDPEKEGDAENELERFGDVFKAIQQRYLESIRMAVKTERGA